VLFELIRFGLIADFFLDTSIKQILNKTADKLFYKSILIMERLKRDAKTVPKFCSVKN
jgi:hypothetical protein